MKEFKAGDIVRYNSGETALVRLHRPHAGGWHADHCMGGTTYVSDRGWGTSQLTPASENDLRTWRRCRPWRGETPVAGKPHLRLTENSRWQCYDKVTSRVQATFALAYLSHEHAKGAAHA